MVFMVYVAPKEVETLRYVNISEVRKLPIYSSCQKSFCTVLSFYGT